MLRPADKARTHSKARPSAEPSHSTGPAPSAAPSTFYAAGPALSIGTAVQQKEDDELQQSTVQSQTLQFCDCEDDTADESVQQMVQLWDCSEYNQPTCVQSKEDDEAVQQAVQLWDCSEYNQPTCVQSKEDDEAVQQCAACEAEEETVQQCASCGAEEHVQQKCAACAAKEKEQEQVQHKCAACAAKEKEQEQVQQSGKPSRNPQHIHREARRGLQGANQPLPYSEQIQAAFGRHDISHVRTNVGGSAEQANRRMGALAFTSGDQIGFRQTPSLHLAAHEAAHVVQQRAGLSLPNNVGRTGDRWERHADAVADAVVAGRSAEGLLNSVATPSPGVSGPVNGAPSPSPNASGAPPAQAAVQQQITGRPSRLFESAPTPITNPPPSAEGQEQASEGDAAEQSENAADDQAAIDEALKNDGEAPPPGVGADGSAAGGAQGAAGGASAAGGEQGPTEGASQAPTRSCYNVDPPPPPKDAPEPTADERGAKPEEKPQITFEAWPDEADECQAQPAGNQAGQQMPATLASASSAGAATGATSTASTPASATTANASEASQAAPTDASAAQGAEQGAGQGGQQNASQADQATTGSAPDSGIDGQIGDAEAASDSALNSYLDATGTLSSVSARAQNLEASVSLPAANGTGQEVARQQSLAISQSFMGRMADQISAAVGFAHEEVPSRLGSLAASTNANIQGAIETEKAAISARIMQARTAARSGAAAARAHIRAEYARSAAQIEAATVAALTALDTTHTTTIQQVNQKETAGLADVNQRFAKGRTDHEAKGPEYAKKATARAQEHVQAYEQCKGDYSDDGFWDGCLTVRRARAQQDAACKTAAGYKDIFLQTANKKAYDLIALRRQYRCAVISGASQVTKTLDTTHDQLVSGLENGRTQAMQGIAQARDASLSAVDQALTATLNALATQEYTQRQAVNDTGYLKQLAVEQLAHTGAANLAQGIAGAMDLLEQTLTSLQENFGKGDIPDPAMLAQSLATTESAITGGMGSLLERMEQGAQQVESQLDGLGGAALSALTMIVEQNDQQATQSETGFAQQMNTLKAGASNTLKTITQSHVKQAQKAQTEGTASMTQAVAGFDEALATIGGRVDEALASSLQELDQQLKSKLGELDGQIAREAWAAAKKEQPAWKSVVAIVLIIVVIIAATVISIVTLGAGASLFAVILVGALVGAVSGGLIQLINNWASGEAWHHGLAQAMIMGAIGGAIGGGLGFAGGASAAGARIVTQIAIHVGTDLLAEGLTQTAGFLLFGQEFNWQGFVMAGAMSGVSFRAHPSVPHASPRAPTSSTRSAVKQVAAGAAVGLGTELAISQISGQKFDPTRAASAAASGAAAARASRRGGAAPETPATGRSTPKSRLGDALDRVRTFDPGGVGARLEKRMQNLGGRLGSAPPTVDTPTTTRPPTTDEGTTPKPLDEGTTVKPLDEGGESGGRIKSAEESDIVRPMSQDDTSSIPGTIRAEVEITIGDIKHKLRLVEGSNGPVLTICTNCQRIRDYVLQAEAVPGLSPTIKERLADLRARVETTEQNLKSGKAPDDVNTMRNMLRLMAEVDFMVPRDLTPDAVKRPRANFADLTDNPAIASRAAELYGEIYAQLWGSRRAMFRGKSQVEQLKLELIREAQARALHQARSEIEAGMSPQPPKPLALEPGAPARTSIDPKTDYPMGFRDKAGFEAFSNTLTSRIQAVDPNAQLVLQGSSLPGRRFERSVDFKHSGEPFDVGRISDYDVAIVSNSLHQKALDARIPLGQGPLTQAQIRALGLQDLASAAQAASLQHTGIAHEVHFKLYPENGLVSTQTDLPLQR
jgi:hypothetical protein